MAMHATGRFKIKSWDEKPYDENGPKLTRASVTNTYQGEIEGEGSIEYLMMYREDGTATYVSMERVVGRIRDRRGSFVVQGSGAFEGGAAKVKWIVVPGSGTGDLRGLRGEGGFVSVHGAEDVEAALDYDFA
jgi:hypothetical protein